MNQKLTHLYYFVLQTVLKHLQPLLLDSYYLKMYLIIDIMKAFIIIAVTGITTTFTVEFKVEEDRLIKPLVEYYLINYWKNQIHLITLVKASYLKEITKGILIVIIMVVSIVIIIIVDSLEKSKHLWLT